MNGLLALLGRSLRVDARSWQMHAMRVALMLAIYAVLVFALWSSRRFGAPGFRFFQSLVWLNVVFLSLAAIGSFSTVITEEKEEDTLGLLQMAGINPLGILLGKTGVRLAQMLFLIALQYPFMLLTVTMGGVSPGQVQSAYLALTSYMLLLAGAGAFASTIAERNRIASVIMLGLLVLYGAFPFACRMGGQAYIAYGILSTTSPLSVILAHIGSMCLYLQVSEILVSGFADTPLSTQVISNSVGGLLLFLLAWTLFPFCAAAVSTESQARGLLTVSRGRRRWFSPGRPWPFPFVWKDFHFVGGGLAMILVRIALYGGLLIVSLVVVGIFWAQGPQHALAVFQFLLLLLVTLDLALLSSRVLHDEVRGQTLAVLVTLPHSLAGVIYGKWTGALLTGLPGLIWLAAACLGTSAGRQNTIELMDHPAGSFYVAHCLLTPHLAAVLATYLRWGSVTLAVAIGVGLVIGWIGIFETLHIGPHSHEVWNATIIALFACVGCHIWIVKRLPRLAARG